MSILDTFFFMFEADTTGVTKGIKGADTLTNKLTKSLQDTDKTTQQLAQSFLKMAENAAKAAVAVVALATIKSATQATIDNTNAVAMQARAIGVSTEALSLWQNSVKSVGGSADQATETITKLAERFRTMGTIGGQSFIFEQLGLSAKEMQEAIKDPTVALVKLSETFEHLNESQRLYLGQKLGLDIGTITLISKGRVELEQYMKRQQELGVVTKEQAYRAAAYKMELAELGTVYETVRRELTSDFLPALTWLLGKIEAVTLYFREHKTFVIAFFAAIAAVLLAVYTPAIVSAAVATWALIAPYVAVGLAIAALAAIFAAIVDDVWAFAHGQDSVIGEMLKKWPLIADVVRSVCEIIKMAFTLVRMELGKFTDWVSSAGAGVWKEYKAAVLDMVNSLVKAFPFLATAGKAMSDAFAFEIKGLTDIWQAFYDIVKKVWEMIKGAPVAVLNWLGEKLAKATGGHYEDIDPNHPKGLEPGDVGYVAPAAPVKPGDVGTGKDIAAKLVASGKWTPAQAAGIAGSFLQESGGRADAKNASSGAYGLGQWLGGRRKDFEDYSGKKLEGSSLDDQIAFFNYETTHKEKRAGDMLRAAQTPEEAARIHSQYYERPGAAEANNARREALAANIAKGQSQIATADSAPLSSMTSQSIANSTQSNTKNVNIKTGPVSVQTAATDGEGTAAAFGKGLNAHLRGAVDAYDDGVAA